MNLELLSPRVWLEIAVAALIAGACWWAYNAVYDRGAQSVQIEWDKDKAAQAAASAKVTADALATTKTLAATIDTQRRQTNAQITALNNSLAGAIAGLRERPSRSDAGNLSGNPATGSTSSGTGAGLYREDGEFLAREAARAKALTIRLAQCQAQYGAARAALK